MKCEKCSALKAELIEALTEIITACGSPATLTYSAADRYDSCALSHVADAMRRLAKLGRFKIESECGRRVFGRFVETKK